MLDRRYESFTEKYETWENEYIFRRKIQNTLYHEKATNAYSRYSRISRSDTVIASNSRDTESIHAICNDRFSQQFNLYSHDAKITLVKDKTRVCRSVINRFYPRVPQNFRLIWIQIHKFPFFFTNSLTRKRNIYNYLSTTIVVYRIVYEFLNISRCY